MFCAFVLYMLIFSTSLCSHLWHSHNLLLVNVTRTLFKCTFIQNCSNALFMLLHIHCFHYNAFSFTNHFRSLRLCLSSQLHLFVATVVQLQYSYVCLSILSEKSFFHTQSIEFLLFTSRCCCSLYAVAVIMFFFVWTSRGLIVISMTTNSIVFPTFIGEKEGPF